MSCTDFETNKGVASLMYLIKIFDDFASKDQDKDHLSKSELKDLLNKEFSMLVKGGKPEDVNKIMEALDQDHDGQVDIQEYMITLCTLGIIMHGGAPKCQKKK